RRRHTRFSRDWSSDVCSSDLKVRLEVEQKRLELMREQLEEQVSAQQAQVDRLRSIVRFRRQELESMNVVSPAEGVLQRLDLEIGQWVNPGVELARVVQPRSEERRVS